MHSLWLCHANAHDAHMGTSGWVVVVTALHCTVGVGNNRAI